MQGSVLTSPSVPVFWDCFFFFFFFHRESKKGHEFQVETEKIEMR